MGGLRRVVALRGCAAALCCAAAFSAAGQALTQDQVRVGMDRATRTPLEIVWLRDEILDQLWRQNPGLLQGVQRCAKAGAPREGCAIGSRPPRQYHLGAGSYADDFFMPLGRGVFIVAPQAENSGVLRVPNGEIVLAAGYSVQLIDVAYPAIRIEVRAPRDRPLALGNLVSADIAKVIALLVRSPEKTSASAASVLAGGRVAFSSPGTARSEKAMVAAIAPAIPAQPHFDIDQDARVAVRANGEGSGGDVVLYAHTPRIADTIAVASAAPVLPAAAHFDIDQGARVAVSANGEGSGGEVVLYARPAHSEPVVVALEPAARPVAFAKEKFSIAAVVPRVRPKPEISRVPDAVPEAIASAGAIAAPEPVVVATLPEPEKTSPAAPVDRKTIVAAVVPTARPEPAGSANPDLARLRAEVEAEVARERERIAAAMQTSCAKPGAYRQGCVVNPPRRFVFAGA